MKAYLPPATLPWRQKIERKHRPKGSYSSFKTCLGWDFGFSCSFCLLHETDLIKGGAQGWSLMQVEHFIPQSRSRSKRNNYKNCFYICERCNKSRSNLPTRDDAGNPLLDPCSTVWADHFERSGDAISPYPEDGGAHYTWECYGLDDPGKVTLRQKRRIWMERFADTLLELMNLELELNDVAFDESEEAELGETSRRLKAAQRLHRAQAPLLRLLDEFRPIPDRSGTSCSCRNADHNGLSETLAEQTVDLADLLEQARARRPPL